MPQTPFTRADAMLLAGLGAPTLAVCILVGKRAWPIGVPGEWTWEYFQQAGAPIAIASLAVMCALLALAVFLCLRRGLRQKLDEAVAVFLCLALALGIIQMAAKADPFHGVQALAVTVSPSRGGYYGEAVRIKAMRPYAAAYAHTIAALRVDDRVRGHVADHPIGPVLFHWIVNRALDRFPSLSLRFLPPDEQVARELYRQAQYLVSLEDKNAYTADGSDPNPNRTLIPVYPPVPLSGGAFAGIWASAALLRAAFWLSLIPLYLLGRDMYSRETGLVAMGLAALIPSLHLFGPYIDQAFPFFGLWAFYAWRRSVRKKSALWAAVAAAALFLGMLWSLSLVLMVAVMGAATALAVWNERLERKRKTAWTHWARLAVAGFGTFLILSLLPTLLFEYDTWSVWKVCLLQHARFAPLFRRSYVSWLLFNPVEFLLFTSVPVSVLFLAATVTSARRWWRERRHMGLPLLPWALLGVLAAADLSGKNLGEVARLWMFLMPLASLAAAPLLVRLDRRRGWPAGCVHVMASAQLIVFKLSLDVFGLSTG